MIIQNGFYLHGFTRIDKGEAGAVFVHYDETADTRAAEIRETPLLYGGENTANYTLSIPKPRPLKITACAVVTRSSKNCYAATVYDERRIETMRADSLDGLRKKVAEFFESAPRLSSA